MKKEITKSKNTSNVTFTLPKEAVGDGTKVVVMGDFSEWTPIHLKVQNGGSFETEIEVPHGRDYHFRYQVDDIRWENDWHADRYEQSPMYHHIHNSVLCLSEIAEEAKPKTIEAPKVEPAKKATASKKVAETAQKVVDSIQTVADDLTKIEGIGPKIAGLLIAEGITTFAALSKSTVENVQSILDKAGKRYNIHNPSTWGEQAAMAAKGNWAALKKWQDELLGGKKA